MPSAEDYADGIKRVITEERIDSKAAMDRTMSQHMAQDRDFAALMQGSCIIAAIIEPLDRTSGTYIDETHAIGKAAQYGIAFGGLLVPRIHKDVVRLGDIKLPIYIDNDPAKDRYEKIHTMASLMDEVGSRGLSLLDVQAEDTLDKVGDIVVPDIHSQRHFRVGCGIVALAAYNAHVHHNEAILAQDREEFAKQLDTGEEIDWEAAFGRLLDTDSGNN